MGAGPSAAGPPANFFAQGLPEALDWRRAEATNCRRISSTQTWDQLLLVTCAACMLVKFNESWFCVEVPADLHTGSGRGFVQSSCTYSWSRTPAIRQLHPTAVLGDEHALIGA
eukprot:Skav205350  [mRNA]  locus=scaffold1956:9238:9576:- [translate_table: standard]